MSKWFALALVCAAVSVIAAPPAVFPSGTTIHIRLTTPVGSKTSKAGDFVHAILIEPLLAGDRVMLPSCLEVVGSVRTARAATDTEAAALLIHFTELAGRSGYHAAIAAKVSAVDNARETVAANGEIEGITASKTLTAEADRGIAKLSDTYGGLGDVLKAAKGALIKPVDPEIDYEAGAELTLELTAPLTVAEPIPGTLPPLVPFSSESGLIQMVIHQPVRAFALNPPTPSDLTNLILVGSRDQVETAFQKAGWAAAASLDGRSKLETFRALAEDRGYKEGPVSILTVDGRPPDLVFEKTNDTFAARHHLRLWRRPGTFDGQPIWLATATHDTGIAYSDRDRTFIHKIDSNIDAERSKVVNDLLDTGMARSFALVERERMPPDPSNATGDRLLTDGRMAVLMLAAL